MDEYPRLVDVKFGNFLRYKESRYQSSPRDRASMLAETQGFMEPPPMMRPLSEINEFIIWQELAKRKREETNG